MYSRKLRSVLLAGSILASSFGSFALADQNAAKEFRIAAQDLGSALTEFSVQANLDVFFVDEAVSGKRTKGLSGSFTTQEAINKLLQDSGIPHRIDEKGTLLVGKTVGKKSDLGNISNRSYAQAQTANDSQGSVQPSAPETSDVREEEQEEFLLENVIVTGTRIRGVEAVNPSVSFDREDFQKAGFNSLSDFLQALPQNLGEISSTGAFSTGASRIANSNGDASTAISLRGLGPESTLSLLNGRRFPGAIGGRVFDVGAIPVSVIENVEVLTGGASAIYGSDAVAGVVNLKTRTSFDGIEAQVYRGLAKNGGDRTQASIVAGQEYDNAGFVIAYDFQDVQSLDATDAGVAGPGQATFGIQTPTPGETLLIPESERHSFFAAGHVNITDNVRFKADFIYSDGESFSQTNSTTVSTFFPDPIVSLSSTDADSEVFRGTIGIEAELNEDWNLDVQATYGERQSFTDIITDGTFGFRAVERTELTENAQISVNLSGKAFTFGDTDVLVSVGAERRLEDYRVRNELTDTLTSDIDRGIWSAYGEIRIPFVQDGDQAGLHRLELSGAVRYDDYSDIGDTVEPQFGIIYAPTEDLTFRGTWSTSFRAPSLFLFDFAPTSAQAVIQPAQDPTTGGFTPLLALLGSSSDLVPEEAESYTISVDYEPSFLENTKFTVSFFSIDYDNRIDEPFNTIAGFGGVLLQEEALSSIITRMPTTEEAQALINIALANDSLPPGFQVFNQTGMSPGFQPGVNDPTVAFPGLVLFNNQRQNIGREKLRGLDFAFSTFQPTEIGDFTAGFNATYYTTFDRAITPTAPFVTQLNEPGRPVDFQFRANVGMDWGAINGNIFVNYTDGYTDIRTSSDASIDSYTTVDLSIGFNGSELSNTDAFEGFRATLSITNIFDQDPPFVASNASGVLFDPTNASPLGRLVALRISKRW